MTYETFRHFLFRDIWSCMLDRALTCRFPGIQLYSSSRYIDSSIANVSTILLYK